MIASQLSTNGYQNRQNQVESDSDNEVGDYFSKGPMMSNMTSLEDSGQYSSGNQYLLETSTPQSFNYQGFDQSYSQGQPSTISPSYVVVNGKSAFEGISTSQFVHPNNMIYQQQQQHQMSPMQKPSYSMNKFTKKSESDLPQISNTEENSSYYEKSHQEYRKNDIVQTEEREVDVEVLNNANHHSNDESSASSSGAGANHVERTSSKSSPIDPLVKKEPVKQYVEVHNSAREVKKSNSQNVLDHNQKSSSLPTIHRYESKKKVLPGSRRKKLKGKSKRGTPSVRSTVQTPNTKTKKVKEQAKHEESGAAKRTVWSRLKRYTANTFKFVMKRCVPRVLLLSSVGYFTYYTLVKENNENIQHLPHKHWDWSLKEEQQKDILKYALIGSIAKGTLLKLQEEYISTVSKANNKQVDQYYSDKNEKNIRYATERQLVLSSCINTASSIALLNKFPQYKIAIGSIIVGWEGMEFVYNNIIDKILYKSESDSNEETMEKRYSVEQEVPVINENGQTLYMINAPMHTPANYQTVSNHSMNYIQSPKPLILSPQIVQPTKLVSLQRTQSSIHHQQNQQEESSKTRTNSNNINRTQDDKLTDGEGQSIRNTLRKENIENN